MNPWLTLALQLEPAIPVLIADFRALFAKHPALADPAAQAAFVAAIGQAAATVDDATMAKWAADQAAHPPQ
jgi:2-hydroxychromene-2-carboxylate isomerase